MTEYDCHCCKKICVVPNVDKIVMYAINKVNGICEKCHNNDVLWRINFRLFNNSYIIFNDFTGWVLLTFTPEFIIDIYEKCCVITVIKCLKHMLDYYENTKQSPIVFDNNDIINQMFPNTSYSGNYKDKFFNITSYLEKRANIRLFINKNDIIVQNDEVKNFAISKKPLDEIYNFLLERHNKIKFED